MEIIKLNTICNCKWVQNGSVPGMVVLNITKATGIIILEITIVVTLISVPFTSLLVSPAAAQNPTSISMVSRGSNPTNKQFYNPPSLTVRVGTVVNWTNNDNSNHTVTSVLPVTGPIIQFDSGIINREILAIIVRSIHS